MVQDFCDSIFRPSIDKLMDEETTKPVMKRLEMSIVSKLIPQAREDALDFVHELTSDLEDNVYTTNDHYMNDSAKEMKRVCLEGLNFLDSSYKHDLDPHITTLCEVQAFLKTRKKVLPDMIQIRFTKMLKDLIKSVSKEVWAFMQSKETHEMIKESKYIVRTRTKFLEREAKVEAALEAISPL